MDGDHWQQWRTVPGMTWIPRRRLIVLTAAAAALVFSAAAAVAGVMLARSDNAAEAKATPPRAATFTLYANLVLSPGQYTFTDAGCAGRGGFDDIAAGTQVVVTNAGGATVGVGSLDRGRYDERSGSGRCVFSIAIQGVPDGGQFYAVEVSHRGKVQYGRADLGHVVTLSIG